MIHKRTQSLELERLWFEHKVSPFHHSILIPFSLPPPLPFYRKRSYHNRLSPSATDSRVPFSTVPFSPLLHHHHTRYKHFYHLASIKWSSVILFMKDFLKWCQMLYTLCSVFVCVYACMVRVFCTVRYCIFVYLYMYTIYIFPFIFFDA